jgi:GntR family transcriptional regulator, transcriptional repressor for pyruvate dehydrogenase complex
MEPEPGMFKPVTRSPLSLLVARQLREAIVSGRMSVGTYMPTEKELTEQFGVSRSTVREAIRVLQAQGLLSGGDSVSTARPKVSAEQASASASQGLENALKMGTIPLADLVELRLLLEGAAVTREINDPTVLEDAREALEVMRTPGIDIETFHAADVRFHICLAGAGGSTVFPLVMMVLRDAIASYLLEALAASDDPGVLARLVDEHAAILDAVQQGHREEAASLMRSHILNFYSSEVAADA